MAMMRRREIGGFDVYDHVARLCSSSILLKHAESHVYLSMYGRKRLQFWKAQQHLFVCLSNSRPIPFRTIYFSCFHFYLLSRGRISLFCLSYLLLAGRLVEWQGTRMNWMWWMDQGWKEMQVQTKCLSSQR